MKKKPNIYERFYKDYDKLVAKSFPKCVRSGLMIGYNGETFFVPVEQLTRKWQSNRQGQFDAYMRGQTMLVYGCYPSDIERFLGGLPCID
jgi:hypothetical protein